MKLIEICDFQGGSQPPKEEWSFEEKEGYIRMLQIRDFTQSDRVIPEYIKISNNTKICEANDILIARYGASIGKILTGLAGAYNVALMRTIPDTRKIKKKYLYYYLKSPYFQNAILNVGSRAAQAGFNKEDLSKLDIECPKLSEQENIVSILDKVEIIIEKRREELAFLDDLIKARFVEMFGDMIINPNGWGKVLLGEACDVRDGTHDSPKYFTDGYPLVTSKNVTGGKIDFADCSLICEEDYNKINQRSKVDMGDILMPMIGTVGNPVIVDIEAEFAIKNVALIKFRENSTVINSFVKALLESDYFDRAVISKVRGGTQKFISLGDIRKLEICLPPIAVQEQFSDFAKQVDKSKVAVQKALGETQTLFDSLMQEYFG